VVLQAFLPFNSFFLSFFPFFPFLSKMSYSIFDFRLPLPSSYEVPAIFGTTTAEQNALILTLGSNAYLSCDKDMASHGDKALQEHLETQKAQLVQERILSEERLKKQHAADLAAARSEKAALAVRLASAEATAEAERAARAATTTNAAQAEADTRKRAEDSAAVQIRRLEQELKAQGERAAADHDRYVAEQAEARKRTLEGTAERIRCLEKEKERAAAELAEERARAAAEREKFLLAEREERNRAAAEIKMENEKRLAAERETGEKLRAAEREAHTRLLAHTADAQKREDDLRAALDRARGLKSSSALKGAANEKAMTDILTRAFDCDFLPKRLNSGDHLVSWEDIEMMVEDKAGYEKGLPKKEIEKAHADFTRNSDCNVLLFVCADSSIPGHTRPGDIDIGIVDNRVAIYIGNFNAKEDKVLFLQTLKPAMRVLTSLTKKAAESGTDAVVALNSKLSLINLLVKDHGIQVAEVRNSANAYARSQSAAWEAHKLVIVKMEDSFSRLLKGVLSEEETVVEAVAVTVAGAGGAGIDVRAAGPASLASTAEASSVLESTKTCKSCGALGHSKSSAKVCPNYRKK